MMLLRTGRTGRLLLFHLWRRGNFELLSIQGSQRWVSFGIVEMIDPGALT